VSTRRPWHPVLNLLISLLFDANLKTDRYSADLYSGCIVLYQAAVLNICKVLKCMLIQTESRATCIGIQKNIYAVYALRTSDCVRVTSVSSYAV